MSRAGGGMGREGEAGRDARHRPRSPPACDNQDSPARFRGPTAMVWTGFAAMAVATATAVAVLAAAIARIQDSTDGGCLAPSGSRGEPGAGGRPMGPKIYVAAAMSAAMALPAALCVHKITNAAAHLPRHLQAVAGAAAGARSPHQGHSGDLDPGASRALPRHDPALAGLARPTPPRASVLAGQGHGDLEAGDAQGPRSGWPLPRWCGATRLLLPALASLREADHAANALVRLEPTDTACAIWTASKANLSALGGGVRLAGRAALAGLALHLLLGAAFASGWLCPHPTGGGAILFPTLLLRRGAEAFLLLLLLLAASWPSRKSPISALATAMLLLGLVAAQVAAEAALTAAPHGAAAAATVLTLAAVKSGSLLAAAAPKPLFVSLRARYRRPPSSCNRPKSAAERAVCAADDMHACLRARAAGLLAVIALCDAVHGLALYFSSADGAALGRVVAYADVAVMLLYVVLLPLLLSLATFFRLLGLALALGRIVQEAAGDERAEGHRRVQETTSYQRAKGLIALLGHRTRATIAPSPMFSLTPPHHVPVQCNAKRRPASTRSSAVPIRRGNSCRAGPRLRPCPRAMLCPASPALISKSSKEPFRATCPMTCRSTPRETHWAAMPCKAEWMPPL